MNPSNRYLPALSVFGIILVPAIPSVAQEAVRQSLAGVAAMEANNKAASTVGYYNLRLGDTLWTFGAGLGVTYQDNYNLSSTDPQSDLAIIPQINTRMLWPVTDKNSLNLTLNAGYSFRVEHSYNDSFFITPGSGLDYYIYVGDFVFDLHDRFSIIDNAYQDPTVANTGAYSQFQNALGVSGVWDLNKAVVRFGYDHINNIWLEGSQSQNGSGLSQDVGSVSVGYTLQPQMVLGVQAGAGTVNSGNANTAGSVENGVQWNVGPFFQAPITEYLSLNANVGYSDFLPESGTYTNNSNFSGMYGQLSLSHRINQYLSYSLAGGRMFSFNLSGGATDYYFANVMANWNVVRNTSLSAGFMYQQGNSGYTTSEAFTQYGPQITLSRAITGGFSANLNYQLYFRTSDQANQNYTANVVTLNLSYQFGSHK